MLKSVRGAYALAILFEDDPSTIIAARNGPPLAIGHGDGEMFLGSDAIALAPFTNEITYLIDGDWAVIGRTGADIFDCDGHPVARPRQTSMPFSDDWLSLWPPLTLLGCAYGQTRSRKASNTQQ